MLKKMKLHALVASIAASCIFGFASAQAGELKIAYIDIKVALENTAEYQSGMQRMNALSEAKIKQLKALKEKISQAEKDLMTQSLAMSQANLSQKQESIKIMNRDFQRMQQDAREELGAEKNRIDMASMQKFQKIVTQYGKDHHYDMIVPRPVFLYADPKHDITGDITKLLDN